MGVLILNALVKLYERLVADPEADVARPGYCVGSASVALVIARDGSITSAIPLGTQEGSRAVPLKLKVPDRVKRTSGDAANFLCDNAEYFLGVQGGETSERSRKRFELAKELHHRVLGSVADEGAQAVLAFFASWKPEDYRASERLRHVSEALASGGNIVFRFEDDSLFVHERPAIRQAWESYNASAGPEENVGQCLITGEWGPIARLHKSISGIAGAKTTQPTLVSFNFAAAESYGKSQGANSPVGEKAAFAYATALNWLTSNERHRMVMGDTTAVFWAERAGPEENLLLDVFANAVGSYAPNEPEGGTAKVNSANDRVHNDEETALRVRSLLERITRGQSVTEDMTGFDENVRFFILGMAPNMARISVRFWHENTFGALLEHMQRHFRDMALVAREGERPVSVGRLLWEITPATSRRRRENVPSGSVGPLMRAILEGSMYPQSLYAMVIERIRSDSNDPENPRVERKVTYPRAAYIKAHLKRKARVTGNKTLEEALTAMLNPENKNRGYLLGRLFALLEKAQQDANPGINTTIKDRYYASASATPAAVFPVLLRLAQHHIAKSEYGGYVDRLIEDVLRDLDCFPAYLNLDDQGLFALGYYHQKDALYKKAE